MIFGVGVGGDHPDEYHAMRVPLHERGSRANEMLEIVGGLFANERFSYAGRHFTIDNVAIAPRPLQPKLPIWVGGTSEAALRRAARYGDGWIGAFVSERKFARMAARAQLWAKRDAPPRLHVGRVHLSTRRGRGEAQPAAEAYSPRVPRRDGYGASGSPVLRGCAPRRTSLRRYNLLLGPVCGYGQWPSQLAAYGELMATLRRQ